MAWVEKDHNDHPVSTPCCGQGCQPQDQLPRATSSLVESLYTEWLRDKGHNGMPLVKQ